MNGILKTLLVVTLTITMLVGCGSASGTGDSSEGGISLPSISAPKDVLIEHAVLLIDEQEDFSEYQVVYYGHDTNVLKRLQVQTIFHKSSGFTAETLNAFDIDTIYPGFSSMSFASKKVYDDGDDLSLAIVFDGLDDPAHLKEMHDNGIITLQSPESNTAVSGDSYIEVMVSSGAKQISDSEAPLIHYAE